MRTPKENKQKPRDRTPKSTVGTIPKAALKAAWLKTKEQSRTTARENDTDPRQQEPTDLAGSAAEQSAAFVWRQGRKLAETQARQHRQEESAARAHAANERGVSPKQVECGTLPDATQRPHRGADLPRQRAKEKAVTAKTAPRDIRGVTQSQRQPHTAANETVRSITTQAQMQTRTRQVQLAIQKAASSTCKTAVAVRSAVRHFLVGLHSLVAAIAAGISVALSIIILLISWMEQNANFREEAISLQAKSKAQQESIEALSAAYAQQRKLTHDFRAHLSTLDGMLMQQNRDINTIQTYIHSLQSKQNERILLVNTHHAALDALLNQKALVAKNRKIDIQFSVNDLSPIKIDMVDLTVVISNTLDNAIEACEKLPETDRQIYVQALLEEDELFYAVRNKSLPVNMIANQLPASTKENPSFHGYGLQNVHTTLEKYHTLYAMDYENGWFEFATELPNTLIS